MAKQVPSMTEEAAVMVASDDGPRAPHTSGSPKPATDTAASPDVQTRQRERNRRKDDPLHKFRVAVTADNGSIGGDGGGGGKRRSSSFNGRSSRREVLYPKSNQPATVWDRFVRPADENHVLSSTAKRMQARRSPRESGGEGAAAEADHNHSIDYFVGNPWAGVWGAKEITNCSDCAAAPSSESKALESAAVEKRQTLPSVLRRVRTSRSSRRWRNMVEPPQPSEPTAASESSAQQLRELSPAVRFSEEPQPSLRSSPPRSAASPAAEGFVLPSKAKALASLAPSPIADAPESWNRRGCSEAEAAAAMEKCNSPFREPSSAANPRASPLIGSLRHKFSMEATEIRDPARPWARAGAKAGKAVMFTNPAYVPSAAAGGKGESPPVLAAANSPPGSHSPSATRRVMSRIGRALSAGRRSISPEIAQRLNSTCQKLISLSPGKNFPAMLARFPSRGRKSFSAPRASFVRSPSCMKPASENSAEEAPSPAVSASRARADGRDAAPRAVGRDGDVSFAAATHNSSTVDVPQSNGDITPDVNSGRGEAGAPPAAMAAISPEESLAPGANAAPDARRARSPEPARASCPADRLGNSRSKAQWEPQAPADVQSSCREWVEKSSPPLPAGLNAAEMHDAAAKRAEGEGDGEAADAEDERRVVGGSPSRAGPVENSVLGPPAGDHATQQQQQQQSNAKKGWPAACSRSSSTGKARQVPGSALLKRATCWMKTTHTPERERPRRPAEVYAV